MFAALEIKQKKTERKIIYLGRKTTIRKHATEKEIKELIKISQNYRETIKLLAIMNLYNGKTMTDTAEYLMISYSNIKTLIKKWNEEGINFLNKTIQANNKDYIINQ